MSDVPELTPEEEREMTRLLAEAGGPVAAPPDVVTRLDDVLAGLVAARGTPEVDEVAEARERRRRWPQVLLAAAAVVVGGYGLGAVTSLGPLGDSGGDRAVSGSAGSEPEESSATELLKERARPSSLPEKSGVESFSGSADARRDAGALVRLQSDRLEAGVRRVLFHADTSLPFAPAQGRRCGPPAPMSSDDSWFRVRLDGHRAVLVTQPGSAGLVDATVYSCDGDVLAEATVTAP